MKLTTFVALLLFISSYAKAEPIEELRSKIHVDTIYDGKITAIDFFVTSYKAGDSARWNITIGKKTPPIRFAFKKESMKGIKKVWDETGEIIPFKEKVKVVYFDIDSSRKFTIKSNNISSKVVQVYLLHPKDNQIIASGMVTLHLGE